MSINKKYVMAGMLATALVAPMTDATNSYADDTRTITGRVNFRTGPGNEYDSMGKIEEGETVTYLCSNGGWRKVKYNSKVGYVYKTYISEGSTSTTTVKYVKCDKSLNVRKGPSTSYSIITSLSNGTKVNVISSSGGWSKITTGSTTGYVSNQYLSNSAPSSSSEISTTKYVVASVGLNVRKGPSTSYAVVTTLTNGTKVTVKSTSNGWSKITSDGITGYVSSSYLSNSKPSTDDDSTNETSTIKYVDANTGLNVRKGPSTSYAVITKLADGTKVTVKSTSNGWSKITTGNTTGYVSSSYLTSSKPSTDNDSTNETSTIKYVDANTGLNVRKGPSTSYAVITKLADGTKVTVKSTSNGWSKITTGNTTGYVSSSYLTSKKPSSGGSSSSDSSTSNSASKLISYAKKFLGKPYVWGAQGPNGFDCSGFTYYVFKNSAGITLPRTSSMQSKYGTYVSKSNLKPGDLLFFDTVGSNNGGVTHCGIYIGNGQMIHAASGQGKVVINNINSSYYVNAYVNARRVL
jgi:uncharacterized protein YgiM (DUF1202 family)